MKIRSLPPGALLPAIVALIFQLTVQLQVQAQSPTPAPKPTPEKFLDQPAAASMIEEFSRNLPDLLADEEDAEAVVQRWKERKDLVAKTRIQALHLFFKDVIAVVEDERKRNKVWLTWETNERNPPKPPPAAADDCSRSKTEQGVVKFFNESRGYGYIIRQGGVEVFLHHGAIQGTGDALKLKEGDRVRFLAVQGPKELVAKCVSKVKK